ncbi:hypothetical protein A2630_02720 [Candidatus Woesebacteria bacterium RIFCSPHIGHO2_01_FULL_44_10]|uniref:Uncharacterized protein n=1 Tax=Candidatus Woesebacteria bacterium RIFCSPLOWO2_01_FULL_44_14 TaxID=1802525 RepID=A0A1F8C3T9_9BACT|nr:MAG: hypothetical protein A2630_02720 [Candidatus Woesebacteria bacterium RIFCSPHIGHO2_01_FULL_44_10]OGM56153.1 MAG: hypothetical protein A3F62_00790 [Candidatus Woesebacteria bacterium RIFCSPHIGHO2_12_FULL_44_11]OGM70956.1 MAG: hypothetical protein A2975_01635 [Candidatus Woesebacteria bacterium RIFCSPLOWO2_01_FULL_44_14]
MESLLIIPYRQDHFNLSDRPRKYGFEAALTAVELAAEIINAGSDRTSEVDFQWRLVKRVESDGHIYSRNHLKEALEASAEKGSFQNAWGRTKYAMVNALLWRDPQYRNKSFQEAALDRSFTQTSAEIIQRIDKLMAGGDHQADDGGLGRLAAWLEKR